MYEKEDMNRRRDRHDIIAEMLKAAMRGKIKTHIMYELKLNYPQVVDYLELLVEKRLLENQLGCPEREHRHFLAEFPFDEPNNVFIG